MKKSILVTGGSGFIGRSLIENLSSNYNFLCPSHKDLELADENATEKYFLKNKVDAIIHCANIGGTRRTTHPVNVLGINLKIFFNLIRCKRFYGKMIFLGSGAEYDKRQDLHKVRESDFDKSVPIDDYGFYKYICSSFIAREKDIVNLRLFGIYGKYEDYELRFISNSICKALLHLPITIKQNVYFDYFYVNDLVDIIDFFIIHKAKYKFYNIGTGKPINLFQIAQRIIALTKNEVPIQILKNGWNKEYSCDVTRLQSEIPKLKFTDLDTSIKEMIEYYQSILPSINKENIVKYDFPGLFPK